MRMKNKDLKRLGRRDLLEMLLELSKENDLLRERNAELEAQLQERLLAISKVGSLAEAALQLSGIFQAAQEACDQYTYNVQQRCHLLEEKTKAKCMQMHSECVQQVEAYEENKESE